MSSGRILGVRQLAVAVAGGLLIAGPVPGHADEVTDVACGISRVTNDTSPSSPDLRTMIPDCGPPNILIIVTDDQRNGTVEEMPKTFRLFAEQGVTFPRAFATTPVCCPSRASIMSGRYTHNHGVKHFTPYLLDQTTTIQRHLKEHGYRTAFYGKYFNAWNLADDPPYIDDWAIFPQATRRTYQGGLWNVNGTVSKVEGYSTDVLEDRALGFIEASEAEDQDPWLMFVSTPSAHLPFVPERQYEHAPIPRWEGNPAVHDDISDKPAFVERLAEVRRCHLRCGVTTRRKQMRTLMSVDDLVSQIFDSLESAGEARNTLAFFLSDNGLMWGEFGMDGKRLPYRPSVEIPMYMRWPARLAPYTDPRIVATIDIAPTVWHAAEVPAPDPPQDGMSLFDVTSSRAMMLLEAWGSKGVPEWASIRTSDRQYIEYYSGRGRLIARELYDLRSDPWQLSNLLDVGVRDGRRNPAIRRLHNSLARLRVCSGTACVVGNPSRLPPIETTAIARYTGTRGTETAPGVVEELGSATFSPSWPDPAVTPELRYVAARIQDRSGSHTYGVLGQDTDGDGAFETSTTFCDQMDAPIEFDPGYPVEVRVLTGLCPGGGTDPAVATEGEITVRFSNYIWKAW